MFAASVINFLTAYHFILIPFYLMWSECYTKEYLIPSTLIGNRLHLLRVNLYLNPEGSWNVRCASANEPSALFLGEVNSQEAENWISVLECLCLSSNPDTSLIPLRIDSNDENFALVCDNNAVVRRLVLKKPNEHELKEHLLSIINQEKARFEAEKIIRVTAEQKLLAVQAELFSVKQKIAWQEKQIELLNLLWKSSTTQGLAAGNYSHCGSCRCPSSIHMRSADAALSKVPEEAGVSGQSSDDLTPEHGFTKKLNHEVSPVPMPSGNSCDSKQQPENFLIGIAQYILCRLCPEQAPDIKLMEDHFLRAHVNKDKKNCKACPSEDHPNLIEHLMMHTNRIYACEYCGKRGRREYLKAHIRTHTGEKPFSCETCSRSFADASTLRRHRLVHSGEKKYSCPICGRRIARKDNVKTHIRSHEIQF